MTQPSQGFPFPFPLSTLLGRVQAIFTDEYDRRLAEAGLSGLSLALGTNVLRHLHDDGVRLTALADLAGVTKQAISQQVAHLESHGYVTVEPDPADSRAKLVRLTPLGRRSLEASRRLFRETELAWQERYGADRVGELRELLEGILVQRGDTEVAPQRRRRGGRHGP